MGKAHWYVLKHHLSISKCKHHFWRLPKKMTCDSEVTLVDLIMVIINSRKLLQKINIKSKGLSRYWWRILKAKYIGDKFEMLMPDLASFIINIPYFLWRNDTIQQSTTYQNYVKDLDNNTKWSPTSRWRITTHLEYPAFTHMNHIYDMILEPFYIPFSKTSERS